MNAVKMVAAVAVVVGIAVGKATIVALAAAGFACMVSGSLETAQTLGVITWPIATAMFLVVDDAAAEDDR